MHDHSDAEQLGTIPSSRLSAIAGGLLYPGEGPGTPSSPRAIKGCSVPSAPKDIPPLQLPRYDPFDHHLIPRDEVTVWTGPRGV